MASFTIFLIQLSDQTILLNITNNTEYYKIKKEITYHSSIQNISGYSYGFRQVSFHVTCDSNASYLVMDTYNGYIVKYDKNWNYITGIPFSNSTAMISIKSSYDNENFITANGTIYKLDKDLNILKTFSNQAIYQILTYNTASDHILVTALAVTQIDIFDRNLTRTGFINFSSPLNYITECNGLIFVASNSSDVFVLKNETISYTFKTACSSVFSLEYYSDKLFLVCSQNIYSYLINGTYTGSVWKNPIPNLNYIGFDLNGDLVLTSSKGLYILSVPYAPLIQNSLALYSDSTCMAKSNLIMKNLYFKII